MTFGREASEAESFAIMDYFIEQGGNFLDTADVYSVGATEEVVGRWIQARGNRNDLVVATKVFGKMGDRPNDGGLSRIHIQQAVEESLRRLKLDVIDLYQIHRWDPTVPIEETIGALDDLVRTGKVRYLGCSNHAARQLLRSLELSRANGLSPFISLQPHYNALNRSIESEILPLCEEEGVGVISYNPLAGGMLTGKYSKGKELPKGARLEAFSTYFDRYYTDQAFDIVAAFLAAAKERSVSPAQLALAWVVAEPRISCPILGARNVKQITDSLSGMDLHLTPEERKSIPAVLPGRWTGQDPIYDR